MTVWDAARVASLRPLKKPYKPSEPVGWDGHNATADNDRVCRPCGHLLCSCVYGVPPYGPTEQGIPIEYSAYVPRHEAYWVTGHNIQSGLLLQKDLDRLKRMVVPAPHLKGEILRLL